MISYKTIRKYHKWPGILFLLPAFLISITAILLSLDGVLHLNRVKTNIPTMSKQTNTPDVKAIYVDGATTYLGTKSGLFVVEGDSCAVVPTFAGFDIKSLLAVGDTLFVASKQGVWIYHRNQASCISKNDAFGISRAGNDLLAVSLGKKGYKLIGFDGKENNALGQLSAQAKAGFEKLVADQPQTLHKLVIDLHTGEAIVGKKLMPYWIAFSSLQLLLLTLTGLWFVIRKKKPKQKTAI